ncbi:MAG: hypothetical protein Q7U71_08175 [bacterium]|nr:hypothetical protein [bacterium]
MKKTLAIVFILILMPAAVFAQWSMNFNYGWLNNACSVWKVYDNRTKPFFNWGNGWQIGGGTELRMKSWLAVGGSGSYQSFSAKPSGAYEEFAFSCVWNGEPTWQAPFEVYARLIKARSLLGTNLKLGLGVMTSHIGQLTVNSIEGDYYPMQYTRVVEGTGETFYRPFGQISAGIRVPITARLGITVDYGYLSTFDRMVQELPFQLGMNIKW